MDLPKSFDPDIFLQLAGRHGHNAEMALRPVGHGADWVEIALDWKPEFASDAETGVLASGPIITMMDMACSMAVWARRGVFGAQVTLDMRVDYLRPAAPRRTVYGRGECYRVTRRIAFVRGQAHDGDPGDPVAHVAGTFMLLDA